MAVIDKGSGASKVSQLMLAEMAGTREWVNDLMQSMKKQGWSSAQGGRGYSLGRIARNHEI